MVERREKVETVKGMSVAPDNHWNDFPTAAENSQRTYRDSKDMISSNSACRCLTHANADLMQAIQIGLEFSLVSCIQSWLITKQRQSFTVSTMSPLPAFPSSATLQHLLAWGIIVDTNTNHVPLAALPALQPLMTFFSSYLQEHAQRAPERGGHKRLAGQPEPAQPVKQVATVEGREWESTETTWRMTH